MSTQETTAEQVSRVLQMSHGDPTWDLSDNDIAALQAVIAQRAELLAVLTSLRDDFEVHHAHGTGANRSTIADWTARVTAVIQSATGAER